MVEHTSAMAPDQMAGLREAARERRMAWARRPLHGIGTVPPPDRTAVSSTTTAGSSVAQSGAGARTWSVNVDVIDRERLSRGWTLRELARHAQVDKNTLGDMLAGRRRPTLGTVRAVCEALALPLAQAVGYCD